MRHWRFGILGLAQIPVVLLTIGNAPARAESFNAFLGKLRAEAAATGISASTFNAAVRGLKPNTKLLKFTKKQPELAQTTGYYLSRRVTLSRIKLGRKRVRGLKPLFNKIERRFGVDPYVVAAIWGMETNYGGYLGKSDIFRSSATLAWKGYRTDFYRKEFLDALRILQTEKLPRARMAGSWAGGLGQTQFIPSSYLKYAVDMDGDKRRDLWRSKPDALGSTANYLREFGWVPGQPWGYAVNLPAKLARTAATRTWKDWARAGVRRKDGGLFPKQRSATLFFPAGHEGPAFLITQSYTAVRKYNLSDSYVLSVVHLADHLRGKAPPKLNWPKTKPLVKSQRKKIQSLLAKKGFEVPNRRGIITAEMRAVIRDYQLSRKLVADGHPDLGLLKALGG